MTPAGAEARVLAGVPKLLDSSDEVVSDKAGN